MQKDLFAEDFFGSDRRIEQVTVLLEVSLQLQEIRRGELRRPVNAASHVGPLLRWIGGESYDAVLQAARESGVFPANADLTDAVKYASDMSTWLSWSFGAAYSLLGSMIDNVDFYVGILPLLVKYGVPTTEAAYISLLGVSDRTAAQILGKHFEETGRPISLQEVSAWLDSIEGDIDKILAANDHGLRTELVTRQVFRGRRSRSPYRMTRLKATSDIPVGTVLTHRLEGEQVLLLQDGVIVGELVNKADILVFSKHALSQLVAVCTSDISTGKAGAVALIGPAAV